MTLSVKNLIIAGCGGYSAGLGVVALLGFVGSGLVAWVNGRLHEKHPVATDHTSSGRN